MPGVKGKKFDYSDKGIADAKAYGKKMKAPVKMGSKMKKK